MLGLTIPCHLFFKGTDTGTKDVGGGVDYFCDSIQNFTAQGAHLGAKVEERNIHIVCFYTCNRKKADQGRKSILGLAGRSLALSPQNHIFPSKEIKDIGYVFFQLFLEFLEQICLDLPHALS